jgi:hypothetical protein
MKSWILAMFAVFFSTQVLAEQLVHPVQGVQSVQPAKNEHTPEVLLFKLGKEWISFLNLRKERVTLSKSCGADLSKMTCSAALSLKSATFASFQPGALGSRNPGSVLCQEVLKQQVVTGTDSQRNENSFCRFKDGSFIDNGSLTYYGRLNDQKNRK